MENRIEAQSIKSTPLTTTHQQMQAKMMAFGGFNMPIQYKGISEEHHAVRNHVGLFDVSHMGEFLVIGKEAEKYINKMVTNDIRSMVAGQVMYSPVCYETGGVVDDLLICKISPTHYWLIVNASNIDKDFNWFIEHIDDEMVLVTNISEDIAEIALQGPHALALLETLTDEPLGEMKYYSFKEAVRIGKYACLVSRTGYTGEDGFELYIENEHVVGLWQLLLQAGEPFGIQPAGLGCRDTLRFEAGMPLYGHELSEHITPIEAGLSHFVKLDKPFFIGKKALKDPNRHTKNLIGITLLDKAIAREGYEVYNENEELIGYVTTGYRSPTFDKSLAFGLVQAQLALGDKVWIKVRSKMIPGEVTRRRFYKKS